VEPGTPRERRYPLDLGRLDPASTVPGAADRLNNLGFGDGSRPEEPTPEFEEAVSNFQRARKLQVTGKLDAATQEELRKAHGS
jgi:peptidoglycan hydrolase-like protein with peptidoglycan-binding domain